MKAILSQDKMWIDLHYENEGEMLQANDYFHRKVKNYHFMKKKFKGWNGIVAYIYKGKRIRSTMWSKLIEMCEKYHFPLEFENFDGFIREEITYEFVEKFCKKLLSCHPKIRPYDYQIDTVYKAVRSRFSCVEVATSGGKTLIMYMYMMLLRYLKISNNILIIEPDPGLVIQSYDEWRDYACGKYNLNVAMIHGGSKDKLSANDFPHAIGNFASLINLPDEFFEKFDTVICDEAHRSVATTIKQILAKCGATENLLGCSGSFYKGKGDADEFTVEENFGPVVRVIKKTDLINRGAATNITIRMINVKFCSRPELIALSSEKDYIEDGEKSLRYEQQFIRNHKRLLEWKCQFICSLKGNTLVYFNDKKGGYGRKIYERLQEISFQRGLSKKVFYIDGDISANEREVIKDYMRNDTTGQSILVANYSVFSTGQSIKNLVNVVTGEAIKSDILLNQSSGRLLRLSDGKEMSYFYDITEDTTVVRSNPMTGQKETKKCFMVNWSKSRLEYYRSEDLIVESYNVDITKEGSMEIKESETIF